MLFTFPLTKPRALLLVEPLQGNSHVSELDLMIAHLEEEGRDEDSASIALLLRFIRRSRALLLLYLSGDAFNSNPSQQQLPSAVLRRFFLAKERLDQYWIRDRSHHWISCT
jgi:hypothetical protein